MLFKSAKVQVLDQWDVSEDEIEGKLKALQYVEASPTQESSIGWVSPFEDDSSPMYHASNGAYLFMLMIEKKSVKASLLKREMDKVISERRKANPEYNPDKDEKNDIKESLKLDLLPNTPPDYSNIRVYIDTVKKYVVIESTSDKSVEMIDNILESTFKDEFEYSHMPIIKEPSDEMRTWLEDLDLPVGFKLGNACGLKDLSTKAVIKYNNHDLDDEKIAEYLQSGMCVTTISMEWKENLTFTMNEALTLSAIKFLDVYKEEKNDALASVEQKTAALELDTNFTIMVGAFREFFGEYFPIFQ